MLGGVLLAAVAVIAVAIAISSSGGSSSNASPAAFKSAATKVDSQLSGIHQSGVTLGSPSAKVTVTEFGDLQCPICRDFAQGSEGQLIANEVKQGKAKLVYKSLETATASGATPNMFVPQQAAANAAGPQQKAWNYILTFYNSQGQEGTAYVNPELPRRDREVDPRAGTSRTGRARARAPSPRSRSRATNRKPPPAATTAPPRSSSPALRARPSRSSATPTTARCSRRSSRSLRRVDGEHSPPARDDRPGGHRLGVATYLTVVHYVGSARSPAPAGTAATRAARRFQSSQWSKLAGIPVALLGLIGYIAILGSLLVRDREETRLATLGFTTIGFGFSAYLTYREAASIHA